MDLEDLQLVEEEVVEDSSTGGVGEKVEVEAEMMKKMEEEEDLKRSGEIEEVEEEKMEEEEERPLPPLPHLPPRVPAQDRGSQAMVFGIPCLWQQRGVNITLEGNLP